MQILDNHPRIILVSTLSILIMSLLVACKGVSGSGVADTTRYASAYRSLRIGQIQTSNNRVAVTTAIDTREVLTILSPDPVAPFLSDLVYQSADKNITQIRVDSTGLPVRATFDNLPDSTARSNDKSSTKNTGRIVILFSNYTGTSVDVQISINGINLPPVTTPLSQEVLDLISQFRSKPTDPDPTSKTSLERQFLLGMIGARIFGCNGSQAFESGGEAPSINSEACRSVLITTMNNVIKTDEIQNRIVDNFRGDPNACAISGDDLAAASQCNEQTATEIIQEALISAPNLDIVIDGTFDPNTGDIIPTPTPTPSPSPTPRPSNAPQPDISPSPVVSISPIPSPSPTPLLSPSLVPSMIPTVSPSISPTSSPIPTPSPTPPPASSSPTPLPSPSPTPTPPPAANFIGNFYVDPFIKLDTNSVCPSDGYLNIKIVSAGDPTCRMPKCNILVEDLAPMVPGVEFQGFSVMDEYVLSGTMTGTIDEEGVGSSTGTFSNSFLGFVDIDFEYQANANGNGIVVDYIVDDPNCPLGGSGLLLRVNPN